jgi:hypothetical protein
MELYFVAAMAESVMSVQNRGILVSLKSPPDGLLGTHQPSKFFEVRPGPRGSLAFERSSENTVSGEKIVVHQRGRLV